MAIITRYASGEYLKMFIHITLLYIRIRTDPNSYWFPLLSIVDIIPLLFTLYLYVTEYQMSVVLTKRSNVIVNSSLFIVLTLLFTITIAALDRNGSVVDWEEAVLFFNSSWWPLLTALLASLSILKAYRLSRFFFIIHTIVVLLTITPMLLDSFDKLTMLLSFLFVLISYYYYLLLSDELAEPIYNPGYHQRDLDIITNTHLVTTVIDKNGVNYSGILTNWGPTSCFLRLNDPKGKPKKMVNLEVNFQGASFHDCGSIVSRYYSGVGVQLGGTSKPKGDSSLGWADLYQALNERGYITNYPSESMEDNQ
jgi:hypothetical protein